MAERTWSRALVTGASSGIGEAFVRSLAADGAAVVAVARREDRLTALADELDRQHGARVEPLRADLADAEQRATVERRLASDAEPVDLLVNNAGLGAVGPFLTIEPQRIDEQIAVNVTAVVHLARAALTAMRPRGRGAVVNVSSLASLQPLPKHAVYAATKAFVTSFSESLTEEMRGSGVTVTAVLPGFIRTEFIGMARAERQAGRLPEFLWMTAEQVAEAGLAAAARGDPVCVPGAGYKAFAVASHPFPRSLKRWVAGMATRDA
jgi:short-subunit dehydrogenase